MRSRLRRALTARRVLPLALTLSSAVSQHLPAQLQRAFDTIRGLDEQDGGAQPLRFASPPAATSRRPPHSVSRPPAPPAALISGLEELLRARLGAEGGDAAAAPAPDDPAAPSPAKRSRPAVPGEADSEQQQRADVERVLAAGEVLAEHAGEKCAAAKECYEAVDALIVRLDRDLTAFDTEFMRVRLAAVESEGGPEAGAGGLGGGAAGLYAGQVKKKKGASHSPLLLLARMRAIRGADGCCAQEAWPRLRCRRARSPRRRGRRCTRCARTWRWTRTSPRTASATG